MKNFFNNLTLDVTIGGITLLAGLVGWIIARITMYKKRIVKQTLDGVTLDVKHNIRLNKLENKVEVMENLIDSLRLKLLELKSDAIKTEQRLSTDLQRVEGKIDKVYYLLINRDIDEQGTEHI